MYGTRVSVVYDLAGRVNRSAASLRDDLAAALANGELREYGSSYRGLQVKAIGGALIQVTFGDDWRGTEELWAALGLCVRQVTVRDEGSDHFPAAGIYHYSTVPGGDLNQVTATVRWKTVTEYAAREDQVESTIRAAYRDSERVMDVHVTIPVIVRRSWELTLVAPNIARAQLGYEMLRGGTWRPRTPFADKLPDPQKVRHVQVTFEPADD